MKKISTIDPTSKRSTNEDWMRVAIESIRDYAIFTLNIKGHIESWNPGAAAIFGYSESEAIGQPAHIIFTPEDRKRGIPEEEMRKAREVGRAEDERWHIRKSGERFYVSGVMTPLIDDRGTLTGYVKIGRDQTERKQIEEMSSRMQDELEERVRNRTSQLAGANTLLEGEVRDRRAAEESIRRLLNQVITVQEEERRRIARELHDTLGQQFAALRLSLGSFRSKVGDQEFLEEVERMQKIFDQLDADVDFLAWELRPAALDQLGLDAVLRDFIREWSAHFHISADYQSFGLEETTLPPEVETNLYRILQEALQNVHKHAWADHVSIALQCHSGQVMLIIEDNGEGYDASTEIARDSSKGMGLINMRERATLLGGRIEIESTPGNGTTIFVYVPLQLAG